jgi:hypothetical protein
MLPLQHITFSLFEPNWQFAQTRYDCQAGMTGDVLSFANLVQVAIRYDASDEWDEIPCETIELTDRIRLRLQRDPLVWFLDECRLTWRQIEFGDLLRRQTQVN